MITVAKDGSGDFTSLQAAVDSLPEACGKEKRTIFVKKGVYPERVAVNRDRVRILGEDPLETVLTHSSHATQIHPDGTERTTFRSWTMLVNGDDVEVEGLCIRNDAGDGSVVGQAVAVYAAGDRGIWRNCRLIAHQDTLYCGPVRIPDVEEDLFPRGGKAERAERVQDGHPSHSRQYFENCYIRGDIDFIFGSYRCRFEGCTLYMNARGGWYTAANTSAEQDWGFVFHRCRLTGECPPGKAYLGRPWRKGSAAVFLACDMDECVAPEGFADWDGERRITDRYGEWGTTGARADLRQRDPREKRLTDEEARALLILSDPGTEDPAPPSPAPGAP